MRDDRIRDIVQAWADDAESELRIHAGVPKELRRDANDIVHTSILGAIDDAIELAAKACDEFAASCATAMSRELGACAEMHHRSMLDAEELARRIRLMKASG